MQKIPPQYYLGMLNQSLNQQSLTPALMTTIEAACLIPSVYSTLVQLFSKFTASTLGACLTALKDDPKKNLKQLDVDLVLTSLRLVHSLQLKSDLHPATR